MTLIYSMPEKEYHSLDLYSSTFLNNVIKYGASYATFLRGLPFKTKSMDEGSVFHCKLLNPDKFDSEFAILKELYKVEKVPVLDKDGNNVKDGRKFVYEDIVTDKFLSHNANDYKIHKEKFEEDNKGKIIIGEVEKASVGGISILEMADAMVDTAKNSATTSHEVRDIVNGIDSSNTEVSVVSDSSKIRIDCIHPDGYLYDVKTTANIFDFRKSFYNYGYALQGAWYIDKAIEAGLFVDGFRFLVHGKNAGYPVQIFEMSQEYLEYGRGLYKKALKMLNEYEKNDNDVPFIECGIEIIEIPQWLKEM